MKTNHYYKPFIGTFLVVFATISFAGTQRVSSVDAVTAATLNGKLKIVTPVTVTSTTATVVWTFSYTDGTGFLKYWTNATDTVAHTLTATELTSKSVELAGLKPATTYNLFLQREMAGENTARANGSMTTVASTVVLTREKATMTIPTRLVHDQLVYGSSIIGGDRIELFDATGRMVLQHTVSINERSLAMPVFLHRVYLLSVRREGRLLSKRMLIRGL
jgi:hypothetical protein